MEGDGFHMKSDDYFTTYQDAQTDWNQVKRKLGITYEIKIKGGVE